MYSWFVWLAEVEGAAIKVRRQRLGEFVISGGDDCGKEERKRSFPGRQLFLQSGACWMFPQRRLWEAPSRLWPGSQIMTIPVLIAVLWLMFDEEGDRLSGCFQRVFTPVSCKIALSKQEIF